MTTVTPVGSIPIAARKPVESGERASDIEPGQYDARRVRPLLAIAAAVVAAFALTACGFGEQSVSVP
ncbi:MAG TPA: hypothetical protein VJ989_07375, partial [Solirubrobacterales bacterium]|nr:hypothetical protein [Solirubrobacterales bacterium]